MKNPHSPAMKPPTQQQIAALAYALWLDAGSPDGRDVELWMEAERQLQGNAPQAHAARDEIAADFDRPSSGENPVPPGEGKPELGNITTPDAAHRPTAQ